MFDVNFVNNSQRQNRLLRALPAKELKRFIPKLEKVDLKFGTHIFDRGDPIDHVYFPTGSVATLLAVGTEKLTLEIGLVGSEGVVGLPVFLGDTVADCRAVVQADGTALRMRATDFAIECRKAETLRKMLLRYGQLRMVQTSLASACHRFHEIEKRLVRWILMTSDRIENSEIRVTHDFLTNILGVRPEEVTDAAQKLAKKDLISYTRNRLVIPDRSVLEAAACRCYKLIRSEERASMALSMR
jgi:CRP-like cAMP-binding protein